MASITLPRVGQYFPEGSLVGAYPRSQWGTVVLSGPPSGAAVETATVTNAALTFSEVERDGHYVAYALVSGKHVHQEFWVTPVSGGGITDDGKKLEAINPGDSGTTSPTPNTSTLAISENGERLQYTLSNLSNVELLWYSKGGVAAVGLGLFVAPGQTIIDETYAGDVTVASPIASHPYAFTET